MSFDPKQIKAFRFISYEYDSHTSTAKLNYAFDDKYFFSEEIVFNGAKNNISEEERQAIDNCLYHLHLVAGSSYYKAAVPGEIKVETRPLTRKAAEFLNKLYLNGLGEFAFRNKMDLRQTIRFPYDETAELKASALNLPDRTIVPVGGGKDSVVTIELLRKAGEEILLFSVGNPKAIQNVVRTAGLPHIVVTRKISPALIELNSQGAYNGHVPISAIIAFIMATASVIYGFNKVAMSNERSANVGNLVVDGFEVNHQYSKGLEFEQDVNQYFANFVLTDFKYFSFLRPLSELAIAKLFSQMTEYHSVFTSCNGAFRLDEKRRLDRWCANCDKCRFVFLCLAPFIEKDKLTEIFGADLLNEENQMTGYDELLGISGHKPFECVGEVEECIAAFTLLMERDEWQNDLMVKRFKEKVLPETTNPGQYVEHSMKLSTSHLLPAKYEEILNENTGSL